MFHRSFPAFQESQLSKMDKIIKILVIDDMAEIRILMERILSGAGFEVLTASSGKEGLELTMKGRPDLILLDIDMPEMNGFEICQALRKNSTNNSMPIIMLTGEESPSAIVRALEQGADDYIIKIDGREKLLKKINHLLSLTKSGDLPSQRFRKQGRTKFSK